ncbi:unnamed protein product [Discosporangium mesarthrocarpum]
MTFLKRDPTLVTLHYRAGSLPPVEEENAWVGAGAREGQGGVEGSEGGKQDVASFPKTRKNIYRFGAEDKEEFIEIVRAALHRFQC